MPWDQSFQPRYLFEDEIADFGLPAAAQLPTVMNLVDAASTLIDEYCGRVDGLGGGSLVYTTYSERVLLPEGRNILRLSFPPLVVIDEATTGILSAPGGASGDHVIPVENLYNGFTANVPLANGNLTPLISASGRYGYARRISQQVYPDLNYGANILQIASFFGGPPQFTPIDISLVDHYDAVAEIWVPAGLYLAQYTEVVITYNSGFDPRKMPKAIKHGCAALVKNFIARGGGINSITSYTAGKVHAQFTEDLIDPTTARYLDMFKRVVAM